MKATITITDNSNGTANVALDFSEPTPIRAKQTAATKIAYELLEHIQRRATKVGGVESHFANGMAVKTDGSTKLN